MLLVLVLPLLPLLLVLLVLLLVLVVVLACPSYSHTSSGGAALAVLLKFVESGAREFYYCER